MNEFSVNIRHLQEGNRQAFKTVFDGLYRNICLFTNRFVNDLPAAEDIVQETFLTLWNHREEMQSSAHVRSFLYMTARHMTLDFLKHEKIKNNYSRDKIRELEDQHTFIHVVIEEEVEQLLIKTEESLPGKCKEIFILAMQGKSNEEIASQLNISVNTVKTQKKIAYRKLKQFISEISIMLFILRLIL